MGRTLNQEGWEEKRRRGQEPQKGWVSDLMNGWLTKGEETQLQPEGTEDQPEAEDREGAQLQPVSRDEEELPPLLDPS